MKNFKLICCIIILSVFCSKRSDASHIFGGEIYYRCLGNNDYEITTIIYRNCDGINLTTIYFELTNQCGYPTQTFGFGSSGPVDLNLTCPTAISMCNGGSYSGIEKHTDTRTIHLPGDCSEWKLGGGELAFNSAFTTIVQNNSDLRYVECLINNTNGICNESPHPLTDPFTKFTVNQRMVLPYSVEDFENDSLYFELVTPKMGPNPEDTVTYLPGYSYLQPLICSAPVSIDHSTGLIEAVPSAIDYSIYAVKISEYRNGVLIGYTLRDMSIEVINSLNIPPTLSGIQGVPVYNKDIEIGQNNCFFITGTDSANNTELIVNNTIPGLTYTNSGGSIDTLFFCWNPIPADTLNNPHHLSITVINDACPYILSDTRDFYFNVIPPSVGIEKNISDNISIVPNPFSDQLNISINENRNYDLYMYDLQGKLILKQKVNSGNTSVKTDKISNGFYMISIIDPDGKIHIRKKLVKNR